LDTGVIFSFILLNCMVWNTFISICFSDQIEILEQRERKRERQTERERERKESQSSVVKLLKVAVYVVAR
jgi:hypothetical protein